MHFPGTAIAMTGKATLCLNPPRMSLSLTPMKPGTAMLMGRFRVILQTA